MYDMWTSNAIADFARQALQHVASQMSSQPVSSRFSGNPKRSCKGVRLNARNHRLWVCLIGQHISLP